MEQARGKSDGDDANAPHPYLLILCKHSPIGPAGPQGPPGVNGTDGAQGYVIERIVKRRGGGGGAREWWVLTLLMLISLPPFSPFGCSGLRALKARQATPEGKCRAWSFTCLVHTYKLTLPLDSLSLPRPRPPGPQGPPGVNGTDGAQG